MEEMLEAELSAHLGYEKYEARGRNSGNSRNGKRETTLQTSAGDQKIQVPRDRNGEFQSPLLDQRRSNELERKITTLYAKGTTTRDIQETIADLYGVEVTAATVSAITDKVWPLVEEWQNRPLAARLSHRLSGCASPQAASRRQNRKCGRLHRLGGRYGWT